MDEGVSALIIVCGLIVGFVGLAIAGRRRKRRKRIETDDLGRRLGARWFTSETGLPYGRVGDAFTGQQYSETGQLFDYAFAAEYRGRRLVVLEYRTVTRSANSTSRAENFSIQLLGPRTPLLIVLPQWSGVPTLFPELTEVTTGVADFDRQFMLLAKDPGVELPPAVLDWFIGRTEASPTIIKFVGDGLEVVLPGGLPGWDATRLINDLSDLADVIEQGRVSPAPRLELASQHPPHNRMLSTLSGCLLGATVVYWLAAFTMKDPEGGLVVIGVLVGLVVLGLGIAALLGRRVRRPQRAGQS